MRRYVVDWREGRFTIRCDDRDTERFQKMTESGYLAVMTLTDEEAARLEKHREEDRFWQQKMQQVDNEHHEREAIRGNRNVR